MKILFPYFFIIFFYFIELNSVSAFIITEKDTTQKDTYFFVSNRAAKDGFYTMYKARTNQTGISSVVIRGNFEVKDFPAMRKAEISVYNISTDELVGVYRTNPKTGNYLIILIPNVKYEFVINTYGYAPIKKTVEIPSYASTKVSGELSRQKVLLTMNQTQAGVSLTNWFIEEKEPTLFLLTVYDENTEREEKLEFYESISNVSEEETDRRQLKEIDFGNIDEVLKKQAEIENKKPELAEKAFLKKEYNTASSLYSELLTLDPSSSFNNYRKGISLYHTEHNKIKALPYLQKAEKDKTIPYDVFYYLGVIYHSWADFSNAENAFNNFKSKASPKELETLNINQFIQYCQNGKQLTQEQYDMVVLDKQPINNNKIIKALPSELINDKLLEKTTFFISPIDLKKKEKLIMFRTEQNEMIQTSYGLDEKNGKDLYVNLLMGGDKWSIPKTLGDKINTPFDEDYAYVTPDGKTLYFASKGHNSMGGYDIFTSTRETPQEPWSEPKNMGYPINSPFDDFMYIPALNDEEACFISNRRSPTGGHFLYKIKQPQPPLALTIIKGHFMTNDSIPNFGASITVINTNNQEIAGIYNTNSSNGNYLMALIPGVKYEFKIVPDEYSEHTAFVTIPYQTENFPLKQHIKIKKEGNFEILNIDNYFTQQDAENAPVYKFTKADFEKKNIAQNEPIKTELKSRFSKPSAEQQQIINNAEQFFINKQYLKCAEQYEKITPLIELSEKQNYMFGKSLFYFSKDYEKIIEKLEKAATNKAIPYDVYYLLGKTNHYAYRFERAVKAYQKYKSLASQEEIAKHDIENEINLNLYGKKIINNPKPIEVLDKKDFSRPNIHTIYNSIGLDSKFLVAPDDMTSPIDKKLGFKPTMYLDSKKTIIYFSSYGETEDTGKDIFMMKKLPDNTWTEPINLGTTINTSGDEDFPYLSNDGKTLFFSSTAHGSMGGYDIFKSTWDEKTNSWSSPINLGAPINSPFDDLFYVEE